MKYIFNVTPVPKPRMTQRDKWLDPPRDRVAKYRAFKDELGWLAKAQKFELPDSYIVWFYLPIPKSTSEKKKAQMEGTKHQVKPDKDNLEKALMDVLRPGNDQAIWSSLVCKYWSKNPRIEILV